MNDVVKLGAVPEPDRTGAAEVKRRASEVIRSHELIPLSREVQAIQIPSGDKMTLPPGTSVRVMQSLGGTFTVTTNIGYMVRIDGADADALGLESPEEAGAAPAGEPQDVEKQVWQQLRTCFDPEIPVNIVDLGLVYECVLTPHPQGGQSVTVKFTLTAPGCGMGDILKQDIESKLLNVPGVREAIVEVVLDPPWDVSRMSEAARLQLGML